MVQNVRFFVVWKQREAELDTEIVVQSAPATVFHLDLFVISVMRQNYLLLAKFPLEHVIFL